MRPTDENQAGSKRPNLMSSSRRANGEINILAMLDGRSGRPLLKRGPALPAALWYASALLLACALVGALAWLAHDGTGARQPGDGGAEPALAAGRQAAGDGPPEASPDASPDASIAAATQALAARIEAATSAATSAATDAAHGNAADTAGNRPVGGHIAPASPAMPAAMPAPTLPSPQPQPGQATIIDLAAPQERLAATPAMPPVPPLPPSPSSAGANPGRDGFHPPPPRMQGAAGPGAPMGGARGAMGRAPAMHRPAQPSMARNGVPARPRRPTASANPAPAVDGDVALITAIIQHTGRTGEQDSQKANGAPCTDRSCGPRMPDRP